MLGQFYAHDAADLGPDSDRGGRFAGDRSLRQPRERIDVFVAQGILFGATVLVLIALDATPVDVSAHDMLAEAVEVAPFARLARGGKWHVGELQSSGDDILGRRLFPSLGLGTQEERFELRNGSCGPTLAVVPLSEDAEGGQDKAGKGRCIPGDYDLATVVGVNLLGFAGYDLEALGSVIGRAAAGGGRLERIQPILLELLADF